MSISGQDKDSTFSVSLWAAVGGAVLAAAAVPLYLWVMPFSYWWRPTVLVIAMCFFGLEISGLMAGLLELRTKAGKIGLIVSAIGILLAIIAVRTTAFKWQGSGTGAMGLVVVFPCIVIAAMAIFAGIMAVARKNGRVSAWMPLLILWLLGPLVCDTAYIFFTLVFNPSPSITLSQAVTPAFALPFGPWATLVAKIGDWPNAGGLFHLPLAIILTVILGAAVTVALKAKNKRTASLSLILFMPLSFVWFIIGFGQLLHCTS